MIDKQELLAVIDAVTHLYDPQAALQWFLRPIPALHQQRPIDLMDQGDGRMVLDLLYTMMPTHP